MDVLSPSKDAMDVFSPSKDALIKPKAKRGNWTSRSDAKRMGAGEV